MHSWADKKEGEISYEKQTGMTYWCYDNPGKAWWEVEGINLGKLGWGSTVQGYEALGQYEEMKLSWGPGKATPLMKVLPGK
jgi:hypothetical protein